MICIRMTPVWACSTANNRPLGPQATGPRPGCECDNDSSLSLLQGRECCVCSISPSSLLRITFLGLLFTGLLRQWSLAGVPMLMLVVVVSLVHFSVVTDCSLIHQYVGLEARYRPIRIWCRKLLVLSLTEGGTPAGMYINLYYDHTLIRPTTIRLDVNYVIVKAYM